MNDTPEYRPRGDDELAGALGDALREAPDDLVIPPPVTDIAQRAAAKARARNARRTVGSVAASVMLVAGGVVAWNAASGGDAEDQDVAVESVEQEPAPAAELDEPAADNAPSTSAITEGVAPGLVDVDPAEYSTAAPLAWTETSGPAEGGGSLMTLPDGRVMARLWSGGDGVDQVLVTSDGVSWDPVAMPSGVSPNVVDLGAQLWVVTGWEDSALAPGDGVYVSSDQGATWQKLQVPGLDETTDAYFVTRGYIAAAAAFGDRAVVTVSSFTDLDVGQIAVDQGIADSPDEVLGWGSSASSDQITEITIDVGTRFDADQDGEPEPFDYETFTFTPEELGISADTAAFYGGPATDSFTIWVGDAGGLTPVADFDGSPARLVATGEGLVLTGFAETGAVMWTSTDAATWNAVEVGDGFEPAGEFQGQLLGGGWSPEGFVVERFAAGDIETLATFPGLSLNSLLSVGPSGLAATVTVEFGSFEEPIPVEPIEGETFETDDGEILPLGPIASKDGIELRFEPDGTGVVIDTASGEVLRAFTEEEVNGAEPPAGVIELEEPSFALRIEDPETGEEIVTFTADDYTDGFGPNGAVTTEAGGGGSFEAGSETVFESGSEMTAEGEFFEGEFIAPENWIGWTANGTDWNFQRTAEAFGLDEGTDAWTQVAVGDGFVIATVETFSAGDDLDAETTNGLAPVRWFIAQAG